MRGSGGVYEYDNNTYSETIRYHYVTGIIGDTIVFDCRVEGNHWYIEGTSPTSPIGNNLQIRKISITSRSSQNNDKRFSV
jgi:hypothetical protein